VDGTERDFTTPREVGSTVLDTAYTTLDRDARGIAWARLNGADGVSGASLWTDEAFPYLMVFTGDTLGEVERRRRAVAIEPMTCPPNAFQTGQGVVDLRPGQEWSAQWGIVPR
jgi:aldose 1-epimerase